MKSKRMREVIGGTTPSPCDVFETEAGLVIDTLSAGITLRLPEVTIGLSSEHKIFRIIHKQGNNDITLSAINGTVNGESSIILNNPGAMFEVIVIGENQYFVSFPNKNRICDISLFKGENGQVTQQLTNGKFFFGKATTSGGVVTFNVTQNGQVGGDPIFESEIIFKRGSVIRDTATVTDIPVDSIRATPSLSSVTVNVLESNTIVAAGEGLQTSANGLTVEIFLFGI